MRDERCETCAWWVGESLLAFESGDCHGRPPAPGYMETENPGWRVWPVTEHDSFCAGWRPKEKTP